MRSREDEAAFNASGDAHPAEDSMNLAFSSITGAPQEERSASPPSSSKERRSPQPRPQQSPLHGAGASFRHPMADASISILKYSIRDDGAATAKHAGPPPGQLPAPIIIEPEAGDAPYYASSTSKATSGAPSKTLPGVRHHHGGLLDVSQRSATLDIYDGQPLLAGGARASGSHAKYLGDDGFPAPEKQVYSGGGSYSDPSAPEGARDDEDDYDTQDRDSGSRQRASLLPEPAPRKALRAPFPFCCFPGNPRWGFAIGVFLLTIFFLAVPVGCVLLLQPLHSYLYTELPAALNLYVDMCRMTLSLDSFEDTVQLFAYFGSNLPQALMQPNFVANPSATPSTLTVDSGSVPLAARAVEFYLSYMTARVAALPESSATASTVELGEILADFHEQGFPAYVNDVLQLQENLVLANNNAAMRDYIANTFYTSRTAATLSQASNMIQAALMCCYDVLECWQSGSRAELQRISTLVGRISSGSAAVINDVFALIEDPRGDSIDLQEIVSLNLKRAADRANLLADMVVWRDDLEALLQVLTDFENTNLDPGDVIPVDPVSIMLFTLPKDWQASLLSAVVSSITVTTSINEYYDSRSPIPQWLSTGAADELAANLSEREILSAVRVFNSYFGLNISKSLRLSLAPEDQEESTANYASTSIYNFISSMRPPLLRERSKALENLNNHVKGDDVFEPHKLRPRAVTVLSLSLGLSVVALALIVCVVRYRVVESPFPFPVFLLMLLLLFVVQVAVSWVIYYVTLEATRRERSVSPSLLVELSTSLYALERASSAVGDGLRLSLMVWGNYTDAAAKRIEIEELVDGFAAEAVTRHWMASLLRYLGLVTEFVGTGFFPMRHQLSSSSSMPLTMAEISALLGIGILQDDTGTGAAATVSPEAEQYAPCWARMGASALHTLTSSYLLMAAASERLSKGAASINVLTSSDMTRSSLEGNCVANAVISAVDPAMPMCFMESVCASPSTYGLLRDVSSSGGAFTLFNPLRSDMVGDLLASWSENIFVVISQEVDALLNSMTQYAEADVSLLNNSRRLIVWLGVFTCLGLQVWAFVVWQLLFGKSFFTHML